MSYQPHDVTKCGCVAGGPCACPCQKCADYRIRAWRLEGLELLERRLHAGGIEAIDLAELVFCHLRPMLDRLIETEVRREVARMLKGRAVVSFLDPG
ncbi:MAG: hypothetical protein HYX68_06770 [Planctomycetes bacterium]|nr:hypothetical protein [Planctomycetota bacterium]